MDNKDKAIEKMLLNHIKSVFLPTNSGFEISYDKNLFETGVVDSAGLISFICFIEKEFGITIPDEDLLPANFATVNSIANYIRTRKQTLMV